MVIAPGLFRIPGNPLPRTEWPFPNSVSHIVIRALNDLCAVSQSFLKTAWLAFEPLPLILGLRSYTRDQRSLMGTDFRLYQPITFFKRVCAPYSYKISPSSLLTLSFTISSPITINQHRFWEREEAEVSIVVPESQPHSPPLQSCCIVHRCLIMPRHHT